MKRYIKKIVMCGDPAVGKTSLIRRFVKGDFKAKYITTLGTVISKKIVEFPEKDISMNMQVWDISGQAEFKRVHRSAFRYAEAAFVVCDLLNPESAESIHTWISNLHQYSNGKVPVIILINKYDLIDRKIKNLIKIQEILDDMYHPMFTTSAKTGHNVEHGFHIMAERLIPLAQQLPPMAEQLVAMPEIFENPNAFLDYMLVKYSQSFGETEMSLHMIRGQSEGSGKLFQQNPKEESIKFIDRFTEIIINFRGQKEGEQLRTDLMEAYRRVNW